jgi:hypothetical protein
MCDTDDRNIDPKIEFQVDLTECQVNMTSNVALFIAFFAATIALFCVAITQIDVLINDLWLACGIFIIICVTIFGAVYCYADLKQERKKLKNLKYRNVELDIEKSELQKMSEEDIKQRSNESSTDYNQVIATFHGIPITNTTKIVIKGKKEIYRIISIEKTEDAILSCTTLTLKKVEEESAAVTP